MQGSFSTASNSPRRFAAAHAVFALFAIVAIGLPAHADDTGSFIVQLGRDTTSVESYKRTPARLEVDQVGRSPRVLRRHFIYELADGAIKRFSMVVTPPGSTVPTQTIDGSFDPDSLRLQTKTGTAPVQKQSVALAPGTVVVPNSSPWVAYESQTMKLAQSKQDSLRSAIWFLGSGNPNWLALRKVAKDSILLETDRGDVYRAKVDAAGRIQGVRPVGGPAQYSVRRVAKLDLDAMAKTYAAREQAGGGLGMLSPRDTVRVSNAGGASLMIDYSRPAKRGRVVYGGVVPYGQVWRTGANAATQFKTDKSLDFGGTVVPAGFYTLWTVPTATGWKLVINSETGQWGTAHDPAKDLYTIDMKVSQVTPEVERFTIGIDPTPRGGVLVLDWDQTRATAEFVTQP
jgi:hypothetical protein